MQSEQTKRVLEAMNQSIELATQQMEQISKDAERQLEQARLFGKRQRRKQGNLYASISGERVKPVKGFDASAHKAERKRAKRAKAATKHAKTLHTQNKAPAQHLEPGAK